MTPVKLHVFPPSPNSRKVIFLNAHLDLNLPLEMVDLRSGAQKALRSAQQQRLALTLRFPSAAVAEAVATATGPDNAGWVTLRREGATLEARIFAGSVGSLREAAEDFLACAALAAKVAEKD